MAAFGKRLDGPWRTPPGETRAGPDGGRAAHGRRLADTDVSTSGARLSSPLPLEAAQHVWLKIPSADVFARVQWVDGDAYGVCFDKPLTEGEAAALQARGKVVLMPRLSLEERLALENWKDGFIAR